MAHPNLLPSYCSRTGFRLGSFPPLCEPKTSVPRHTRTSLSTLPFQSFLEANPEHALMTQRSVVTRSSVSSTVRQPSLSSSSSGIGFSWPYASFLPFLSQGTCSQAHLRRSDLPRPMTPIHRSQRYQPLSIFPTFAFQDSWSPSMKGLLTPFPLYPPIQISNDPGILLLAPS